MPAGQLANLRRRIYLTYRYHGLGSVAFRVVTFPLRFTPMKRFLRRGLTNRGDRDRAIAWYRRNGWPVAIVIPSYRDAEHVAKLVRSIRRTTRRGRVRIIVADDASGPEHLAALRKIRGIEVISGSENVGFAANVNRGLRATRQTEDVVLLNSDMIARRGWLQSLQFASSRHPNVGVLTGKLLYEDDRIQFAGTVRNQGAPEWFDHRFRFKPADWGPANVGQPLLAATGACLYLTRKVIERVGLLDEAYPMAYEDVDYCLRAWHSNLAVLYVPDAELNHLESVTRGTEVRERERNSQRVFWQRWGGFFDARDVRAPDGSLRVIYVTQDTGVGGGHRVVFEQLNGLHDRGHQVELWTLTGGPEWFDLRVPVRTFKDYPQLSRTLAPIDAIKVATWWETAAPVWEASVLHGIPVYFVQDIESSYYADSEIARHRVLASYRHEFRYCTTSSWNHAQLREIGLEAALIPPGVDLDTFHSLPAGERRDDMVLAVGRSNPLKNLPLTLDAWGSLTEPRAELVLYGVEPKLSEGMPGVRYVIGPTDAEINRLLNQATLFVQTSAHEGFCLPVLEAMAAGCPVVCTDAHGNQDFCRDGDNCLMPTADSQAVAEALRSVLSDTALRDRLRDSGLATARRYGWPASIDLLEQFLEGIAAAQTIAPSTDTVPELRRAPMT